jgi:hypothetical protein
VLLGCAVATKQWAWLGVLPVVLLAPTGFRKTTAMAALAVVAVLTVPMAIGNFGEFRDAADAAANPPGTVKPLDIWFPFADQQTVRVRTDGVVDVLTVWKLPKSLDDASHPLVLLLALALTAAWWKRGRRSAGVWLLALLLLIRVLGDPHAHPYHHAPFVLALATAEALQLRRFPWATVAVCALLAMTLRMFDTADWDLTNVVYLAWALPAAAVLSWRALSRG